MGLSVELLRGITQHVEAAQRGVSAPGNTEHIFAHARRVLETLPLESSDSVLKGLVENADRGRRLVDLSPPNWQRGGLTLSTQERSGQGLLVRLYLPAQVPRNLAQPLLNHLYPSIFDISKRLRIQGQLTRSTTETTSYFSGAELAVRMIANAQNSRIHPRPTGLVDQTGSLVGFTVLFPEPLLSAGDFPVKVTDTFFDEPLGTTYGPGDDLPRPARSMFDDLKRINVTPYIESHQDTENMLLFGSYGDFVTFNRLGYIRGQ